MEPTQLSQLIEMVKAHLQPEWMNPKQLEEETGIALKTQANMRSLGKIPYYRVGNVVRYKRSEIDALFESAKVV